MSGDPTTATPLFRFSTHATHWKEENNSKQESSPACRRRRFERGRLAEQVPVASASGRGEAAWRRPGEGRFVAASSAVLLPPMPSTRRWTTASSTARPRLLRSTVPWSSSWRRRSTTVPSSKPRSLGVEKRGQRRREGRHRSPQTTLATATAGALFFRCRVELVPPGLFASLRLVSELNAQDGMAWSFSPACRVPSLEKQNQRETRKANKGPRAELKKRVASSWRRRRK